MSRDVTWNLQEQTVLISGGARGIGRALVQHFALAGANVVFGDNDHSGAQETLRCESPTPCGTIGQIEFVPADFSQPDAWQALLHRADERGWRPNVLIPNVGVGMRTSLERVEITHFENVLRLNVTSALAGVLQLLPRMKQTSGGRSIILISSAMARAIFSGHAGYTISKTALLGMTRALAAELAPEGIRVNCILPGFVAIGHLRNRLHRELWDAFNRRFLQDLDPVYASLQPLPHVIRPDDIARAALFLASDAARTITGLELVVDGGLSLQGPPPASALERLNQSSPAMEAWLAEHAGL